MQRHQRRETQACKDPLLIMHDVAQSVIAQLWYTLAGVCKLRVRSMTRLQQADVLPCIHICATGSSLNAASLPSFKRSLLVQTFWIERLSHNVLKHNALSKTRQMKAVSDQTKTAHCYLTCKLCCTCAVNTLHTIPMLTSSWHLCWAQLCV